MEGTPGAANQALFRERACTAALRRAMRKCGESGGPVRFGEAVTATAALQQS